MNNQTYIDTAHLLRRAGFGGSPDEIAAAAQAGLSATTDRLVNYDAVPDAIDDNLVLDKIQAAIPLPVKQLAQLGMPVLAAQAWFTYRLLATQRPLQEKMVLFWQNHFTSREDGLRGDLMVQQDQIYRKNALGNFRTLALAVSKNPEMLRYLNGAQNYKAHPNENFARELMELFTCGRVGPDGKPNYTEDDIKNSARAFSGWNLRRNGFYYNAAQHDDTPKTFMGHTGNFNGDDIVDMLVALPATAYYLCHKLFRYFAYDSPEPAVMDALVQTYFDSGYEVRPIVEQILKSTAFYSPAARTGVIKAPVDYVVGTVRVLGMTPTFAPPAEYLYGDDPSAPVPMLPTRRQIAAGAVGGRRGGGIMTTPVGRLVFLVNQMRNMGQSLFQPPTVKGWDGGTMWINTDTLQARARFATALSAFPNQSFSDLGQQLAASGLQGAAYTGGRVTTNQANHILDAVLNLLGPLQLSGSVRQAILEYAVSEPDINACARGILSLAMSTPDYQLG